MCNDQVVSADMGTSLADLSPSVSDKNADTVAADVDKSETVAATGCSEVAAEMSGASSEASDDSVIDQWRRSVVVSDVPRELVDMLIMNLELKRRGGGRVDYHAYDADSRTLFVTFTDAAGQSLFVCWCDIAMKCNTVNPFEL